MMQLLECIMQPVWFCINFKSCCNDASSLLQKGCRVQANSFGKPVKSLTARTSLSKLTRDPCLLATFEASDQLGLYRITDDFGTILPFKSFNSGSGSNLNCAIMAPILSYRYTIERFLRFYFVVKTSADNVIWQIFCIFSHDFSLFFKPIEFLGLYKVN